MLKLIYINLVRFLELFFGISFTKRFDSYVRFRRVLNLKEPSTLADKVSYIELNDSNSLRSDCSDKYDVRLYVKNKGLGNILPKVYTKALRSFEQMDLEVLPNSFVIKATHGCRMNFIVCDKGQIDSHQLKKIIDQWLNTTYGLSSLEPHYRCIPHRFYVEEYLGSNLTDYKIHCLNGIPKFILVCSDRDNTEGKSMGVTLDLFNTKWEQIRGLQSFGSEVAGKGLIKKPKKLNEMLEIAKILSTDFEFVRVDLYEIDEQIYFSELTFSPACGIFPYFTESFIMEMGKELKI